MGLWGKREGCLVGSEDCMGESLLNSWLLELRKWVGSM